MVFTNDVVLEGGTVDTITNPVTVTGTVTANAGTGTMLVDGSAHTQPVSGTVAVTQNTSPWVVSGTVTTSAPTSNTATVTQVTSSGANQTLLAANPNRKKAIFFFENSTFFVKFGAVASSSSYTYKIVTNSTTLEVTTWTGQIDAVGTANKIIAITELV